MDPLSRMNAQKRNPLQAPPKTDKPEIKPNKQAKPADPVRPKEETPPQKQQPQPPPPTQPELKVQKPTLTQIKEEQKKIEAVSVQANKQEEAPQKPPAKVEAKQDTHHSIPTVKEKGPVAVLTVKTELKQSEKREAKDILSLASKPKQPLQHPTKPEPTKAAQPKKEVKQVTLPENALADSKPLPSPPPKKEPVEKIQEIGEIGERMERKQSERHPVQIQVSESHQKGAGLLKTTFYHITGEDKHGSFAINRKYDEFEALSDILHERWPGCFLPALSKESEGQKKDERDRHLRATLASFLLGLSYSSCIYYREEVQLFLRSPDVSASEMFKEMPPLKTRDVISRFRSSFGVLLDQPVLPAHTTRINSFVGALRKVIGSLGTLSLKALALSESYEGYSQSLGRFCKVHKAYQQLCLTEYWEIGGQRAIVVRDAEHKLEKLQELTKHNPFLRLHSFLSNEVRDAEAFLEVIIASELFVLRKEDLEREIRELQGQIEGIMLGHMSLKTMATRRAKEEVQGELEARQKRLSEERETMVEMFSVLQILLVSRSIPHFQEFKRDSYRGILEEWAQAVQQSAPELEAVWQFIAQDSRHHLAQ